MKTKKIGALSMSGVLMAGMLAGCGGGNGNSAAQNPSPTASHSSEAGGTSDKPYAGQKLSVYLGNLSVAESIRSMIPEFESETGISVEVQSFAEDQLSQKLSIQFTTGAATPDVYMMRPLQEAKLFAVNGWAAPLDDYVQDPSYAFDDFSQSAIDSNVVDGKLIGIPVLLDQTVLYYRKDLLEQAGLPVPKTLDELHAAIEKLHDPDNGVYGFVARGQRSALVTQVAPFLFSEGADFSDGDKATLNTPEAVRGFERYANWIANYGPPGVMNMSWPQGWGVFAQGKAAFFVEYNSSFANGTDPEKSIVADKIGYAVFPAGAAGAKPVSAGTWSFSINPNSANRDAAWQFIQWATTQEMVLKLQKEGNPGVRDSVWNNPEANAKFPPELVEAALESFKIGVGHDRPKVIRVAEAREVIGDIVIKGMLGEDIQKAADEANAAFQKIIDADTAKE